MKNKIIIILLFLWASTATSLLIVVFLGGHGYSSPKVQESGKASVDTSILSGNNSANSDSELQRLQKENSNFKKIVKSLPDEFLPTKSTKPTNAYQDLSKESVEALWNKEFSSYYYKQNHLLFESLELGIELAIDISAAGEPGIDTLIEVILDKQRVKEERETAWEILSFIPDKKVLETIMTSLPDEDNDQIIGGVWRQVKKLPTSDVEEFIPELNKLICEKYSSTGSLDGDEIKTLSFLALKHDSSESLNILSDSGVCDKSDTPLHIADYLHTDSTRNFIKEIYSDHSNETYREGAKEILNCW